MRRRRYNPTWNQARAGGPALEQLKELLAVLRAAYETYRTSHWQATGEGYYGDHLMLQRIYEDAEKAVDQVAERTVGYYGAQSVDLADQAERVRTWSATFGRETCPVKASLLAARAVRDQLVESYDAIRADRQMSLGLDDLLMTLASKNDEHQYLLQQALEGRAGAQGLELARAANRGRRPTICDPAEAWATDQENLRRMEEGLPVTFAPGSAQLIDCSYDQVVTYYRKHPEMLFEQTPEEVAAQITKRRLSHE